MPATNLVTCPAVPEIMSLLLTYAKPEPETFAAATLPLTTQLMTWLVFSL